MKLPKGLETLFAFYPALQAGLIACDLWRVFRDPSGWAVPRLIFSMYLLSPLLWGLFRFVFRADGTGAFHVGRKAQGGNLWLLSYQLQVVYTSFSVLERTLRLVPGLYSAWLRLWGSRIGKKVNWTPECQLVDRGHLEIGDRAFIGNRTYLSAHALKKSGNRYFLFVERVSIGADTMVSYGANIGPGVEIGNRAHIGAGAALYPKTKVASGESYVDLGRTSHL